jgi:large subunit ribosomal protein L35
VLPAYDEALKLIRKDSKALKGAMGKLRIAIGEAEKAALRDEAAIVAMKEKLQIVEVQSEINLPDVRWKFANGMGALA